MPVTEEQLRRADAAWKAADADAAALAAERKRVIRQALREGWTHARVAEVLGLSRGRISQI